MKDFNNKFGRPVPVRLGDAELRTASPADADRSPRDRGARLLGELGALSWIVSSIDD